MTHPKKKQFSLPKRDVATVGRIGGGFPLPIDIDDSYQMLYGVGSGGIAGSSQLDVDSNQNQGMDNDDTGGGTGATGNAAGGTASGAGPV